MELSKILLLLMVSLTSIYTQTTYKRACDCEYTIDGKCAYTLLLPKGQDTCSQDGSTQGGNSPDPMTSDVMATLVELQTNVSTLWSISGDQARMLNQIHSMFLGQQEQTRVMLENMTMMSQNALNEALNALSGSMTGNATEDVMSMMTSQFSAAMASSMAQMEQAFGNMNTMMSMNGQKIMNLTMTVDNIHQNVENLTMNLDKRIASLHEQMKMDYFLCHEKGLLVSGSKVNIPEDQITASSQFNANHHPGRARINTMASAADYGAWCPAEPNLEEWIQLDLGAPRTIYAIVTRGRPDYEQWVTKYLLQYTETLADDPTETKWVTYKDLLEEDMVFDGNDDQNTKKINDLWQPIRVQYVRIVPTAAYQDSNKCMRVDLLGCVDSP